MTHQRSTHRALDVVRIGAEEHGDSDANVHRSPGPFTPVIIGPISRPGRSDDPEELGAGVLRVAELLLGLGTSPVVVTRVGDDPPGRRVAEKLRNAGATASGVQVDGLAPTWDDRDGSTAAFERLDPTAASEVVTGLANPVAFQTATALSSEPSLATMNRIRELSGCPFFVDIDLGQPWMTPYHARRTLLGVRWIRIRADQLNILVRDPTGVGPLSVSTAAMHIRRSFALEAVVVDAHGLPVLIAESDRIFGGRPTTTPTEPDADVQDAVTASLVFAVSHGLSIRKFVQRTINHGLTEIDPRTDPSRPPWRDRHPDRPSVSVAERVVDE